MSACFLSVKLALICLVLPEVIATNTRVRFGRQARWLWGSENDNKTKEQIEEEYRAERALVCDKPDQVMPNYTAPGLSISGVKCQEYIWQIQDREYRRNRALECEMVTLRQEFEREHGRDRFRSGPHWAIGGRPAKPGEYPHMGGIGWKAVEGTWIFKCGATLISEKWVLTAAHCSNAGSRDTRLADPIPKIIRFGDKTILDTWQNGLYPLDRNISDIKVHPQYRSPRKYYDIALMELDKEITFNYNVQPACLWRSYDVSSLGKVASVTGWGVVESNSEKTSPVLQAAKVDFINSSTCDRLLRPSCNRHWCGIVSNQICAGKLAGGVDACRGDSGGPLSVQINLPKSEEGAMHHVVGVTSFGFGCARKDTPGIYTRVSKFVPWIEKYVWPE